MRHGFQSCANHWFNLFSWVILHSFCKITFCLESEISSQALNGTEDNRLYYLKNILLLFTENYFFSELHRDNILLIHEHVYWSIHMLMNQQDKRKIVQRDGTYILAVFAGKSLFGTFLVYSGVLSFFHFWIFTMCFVSLTR
jgi:hypothetical protein